MIRTEQRKWTHEKGWEHVGQQRLSMSPQLVLGFGARTLIEDARLYQQVRNFYPGAYVVLCSTAGEILDTNVLDQSVVVTAVHFEKSIVRFAETEIHGAKDSLHVGKRLAEFLPVEGLVHAMVFSDGLNVNGTLLAQGINDNLPVSVTVTGGLVGDGSDFKKTVIGRDGVGQEHKVVLLGFYGDSLNVGYGSFGGWEKEGEPHVITKSDGNTLIELDGRPALSVYIERIKDAEKDLPASALQFPFSLHADDSHADVVRTVIGIDREKQTMTFAGDMPQGAKVFFMHTSQDRLIRAAETAANMSMRGVGGTGPSLAILISCIGRKLVFKEDAHKEIEAVREAMGNGTTIAGFYSYGELCPGSKDDKRCLLHNQTMTITTFKEH